MSAISLIPFSRSLIPSYWIFSKHSGHFLQLDHVLPLCCCLPPQPQFKSTLNNPGKLIQQLCLLHNEITATSSGRSTDRHQAAFDLIHNFLEVLRGIQIKLCNRSHRRTTSMQEIVISSQRSSHISMQATLWAMQANWWALRNLCTTEINVSNKEMLLQKG